MEYCEILSMVILESQILPPNRARIESRSVVRIVGRVLTLLFSVAALINLSAFVADASILPKTHLAAVVLSFYLLVEARLYLRRSDTLGLLSPSFLALVFHFFLSYLVGITGASFQPRILDRFASLLPDLDNAIAGTLLMAVLAIFCMMRGYRLAQPLARSLRAFLERMPQIRAEIRPAIGLVIAMQFAYLGLVAYAIDLGVYGLLSTAETRAQHLDLIQFLNLALASGTLSYFFILLRYFQRRATCRAGALEAILVALMIGLHVFAGVLAAFKSQMVFPFVIAGLAYFLVVRRLSRLFIILAVVALITSYSVIEPFRAYLGWRGQAPGSVVEAVEALRSSQDMLEDRANLSDVTTAEGIALRLDLSGMTSVALDYVDRGNLQASRQQVFQDSILLAPFLAYVPRAVWAEKPIYSDGVWFNQSALGRWNDESTSVGMGPIGYLYMASGVVGVILGFLFFGMLQALVFEGIGRARAGGLIIFLSVAGTLIMIPSSFGPALTGLFQVLPATFVAQLVLLRPSRSSLVNSR